MSPMKILVIDDNPQTRRAITATLVAHGYEVLGAPPGEDALKAVLREMPQLVLLDMNIGIGGLELCRTLRSGSNVPVISISACNAEADKVAALDAGADDYVTRPFSVAELLARIRAALRRSPSSPVGGGATFGGKELEIDFASSRVRARGTYVRLTPMECKVLRYLVSHEGKPVSHRELLKAIWGPNYSQLGPLRVLINHMRKKIEQHPANPKYILTEPWVGYKFADPV